MRDKTHLEQVERWAEHVRDNPEWKKQVKSFLDSQIIIANRFYKKLAETSEGREKLKLLGKLR